MFSGVAIKITLMLVVLGTTLLLLNQSSYPMMFFRNLNSNANLFSLHQYMSPIPPPTSLVKYPQAKDENIELEKTLRSAVMKDNRTVIITNLNAAWTEPNSVFDLFLESFKIGNGTADFLDHLVVYAFDKTAYERCKATAHLHCYAVTTKGVNFSGEAYFMSEDYLKMTWRKIELMRTVLELGYDFIYTDADVMWFRNPFKKFYGDGDFETACDHYSANYRDVSNTANTGFTYVKSNDRTIELYKYWYNAREYFPGKHDQDVLNMIKGNPFVHQIGLEFRFLDTAYFGGFCEPNKDLDEVITMHANCCIGIQNKMHDLTMIIHDWKGYMELLPSNRNSTTRSWTVPRICH
ncbi:uncharacterized protein At4g15970-like [Salvia hispanica]|uniref:uncharacterized protein At4g15970-like n=1 Tax=Salvia hispanica TaxID=49212 RepID=UPI002009AAF8|nr:uncharacterized protein At4g15970-like [Salvia hispanica]